MRILVLGHNGMLGNAVFKYLSKNHFIETTDYRWPNQEFINFINNSDCEWIVNCVASIPQKNISSISENLSLPLFLISTGKKIIHPGTDGEFSGIQEINSRYSVNDDPNSNTPYGISKGIITTLLKKLQLNNLFIIRSSIIGIDKDSKMLLSWFLSQNGLVNGYTNHYWNGITTLEWAKISEKIIQGFYIENVIQPSSSCVSKFELLSEIRDVFRKEININPTESAYCNNCLQSNIEEFNLRNMLYELKDFYSL